MNYDNKDKVTTTYLCGGINALSDSECSDWRNKARKLLKTPTLDPMRRDYRGKEDDTYHEIVKNDLHDIAMSANILVNATKASWGTAMEIVYAKQLAKFIVAFTGNGPVSPWLREHCNIIVKTLDEAIANINARSI